MTSPDFSDTHCITVIPRKIGTGRLRWTTEGKSRTLYGSKAMVGQFISVERCLDVDVPETKLSKHVVKDDDEDKPRGGDDYWITREGQR